MDDVLVDPDPDADVAVEAEDRDVVVVDGALVDDPVAPFADVLVVVDDDAGFVVDVVVVADLVVVVVGCGTTGTYTGFAAGAGRTASHSAPTPRNAMINTIVDRRTRNRPVSAM